MSVDGKVILITGASRGFGLLLAQGFVEAGARVVATARTETAPLRGLAQGAAGRMVTLTADIGSDAAGARVVEAALAAYGRLDVLVNNAALGMNALAAGGSRPERFWELAPDDYRRFFETNVIGPFLLARRVVPHMLSAGGGRIVNLTTGQRTMQMAGYTPYGPTKAALEAASVAWAQELRDTGVTVNVLIPGGPSRTGMIREDPSLAIDDADLVDPRVIVRPALWLASDAAAEVTGCRVVAVRWRPDLPESEAARLAVEPAGW